jgi:hypothetical protein
MTYKPPRYTHLNSVPLPLSDGLDPPAEALHMVFPEERSGKSRKCVKCGNLHDVVIHDTKTGKVLEELDKCKDCLFSFVYKPMKPLTEQIILDEK